MFLISRSKVYWFNVIGDIKINSLNWFKRIRWKMHFAYKVLNVNFEFFGSDFLTKKFKDFFFFFSAFNVQLLT